MTTDRPGRWIVVHEGGDYCGQTVSDWVCTCRCTEDGIDLHDVALTGSFWAYMGYPDAEIPERWLTGDALCLECARDHERLPVLHNEFMLAVYDALGINPKSSVSTGGT